MDVDTLSKSRCCDETGNGGCILGNDTSFFLVKNNVAECKLSNVVTITPYKRLNVDLELELRHFHVP